MPSTIKIPGRTERRCTPCEHLRAENMICSRLHGITCDYVCYHPRYTVRGMIGLLPKGQFIGKQDVQPDWCPLLTEIERTK